MVASNGSFEQFRDFFKYVTLVDLAAIVGLRVLRDDLGLDRSWAVLVTLCLAASVAASVMALGIMVVLSAAGMEEELGRVEWLCFWIAFLGLTGAVLVFIPSLFF